MNRIFFILIFITSFSFGQLAFPDAKGFGRNATGGRGGQVIHVTNLNASGAGSLRAALETTGPRYIVFDVAGDIELSSRLIVGAGTNYTYDSSTNALYEDVTIMGETAPSPGITLRTSGPSSGIVSALMTVQVSNVIIRYMTFRTDDGDTSNADGINVINQWDANANEGGTYQYTMTDVILDHLSISNGSDENFAVQGVDNFTLQNSIITNPDHSGYNFLFGYKNYDHTYINNLISHGSYRNPLVGYGTDGSRLEFINNIVFGYDVGGTDVVFGNYADIIANLYKAWEDNPPNTYSIKWDPNATNNPGAVITDGAFYAADNIQVNPAKHSFGLYNPNATTANQGIRVLAGSFVTSYETSQAEIENDVFYTGYGVGNSIYRDALDDEAISDYIDGSNERELDSFIPNKTLNTRPSSDDSDNDDMLDAWEILAFGSITAVDDPNGDYFGRGYDNIEYASQAFLGALSQGVQSTFNGRKQNNIIRRF